MIIFYVTSQRMDSWKDCGTRRAAVAAAVPLGA
jgi:hypothetical protein